MTEDAEYSAKYKEIKRRIRDIEEENDALNVRLYKARKSIKHLKLERTFLLDRMDKFKDPSLADNDHSDFGSDIDAQEAFLHKPAKHARGRVEKKPQKVQRKKKDPNAPKGPGNVFFIFSRLEREKIKDENPAEHPGGDVTKLVAQKWKSLKEEEKQKYYAIFEKEKEEYDEAMKVYTGTDPVTDSIVSSPTQSTVISADYPSDPPMPMSEDGAMEEDQSAATDSHSDMDPSLAPPSVAPLSALSLPHPQQPMEPVPPPTVPWPPVPGNEHSEQS